jgi:hypothetical protein
MIRTYGEDSRRVTRAIQIFVALVGQAPHGVITYNELGNNRMRYGQGILDKPLGYVMAWCFLNGLPPLTALVVNSETGEPGYKFMLREEPWPHAVMRVKRYPWATLCIPTESELIDMHEEFKRRYPDVEP